MITSTTPPSETGTFFIITRADKDAPPNRRPLDPGHYENGAWINTDLSDEPDEVKAAAKEAWTPATIAAYQAAFPWVEPPPPKPPELEPYQFFAMLEISGKQAALTAFINALPSPQNIIARNKLNHTLSFHRDNDLVLAAQQALVLTDAQLDALWAQAASIK